MPLLLTRAEEYAMRVQAAKQAKVQAPARVKAGRKGQLPQVTKVDPLARAEFEPDNNRIGCESKGIQSKLDFATLAAIWVYEWHVDLEHPMLRSYVPVAPILPTQPYVVVREAMPNGYTTAFDKAKHIDQSICAIAGEWLKSQISPEQPKIGCYNTVNNNPIAARQESKSWQSTRTPKSGQRPQVTFPKSSR